MTAEKTIGIIIARMASTRLPGKALRLIEGKPLLSYTLERLKQVAGLDEIWLATTQHPSDEPLMLWAVENNVNAFAWPGETDDLVGRVASVVRKAGAERFIAVLGDTPFVDSRFLNRCMTAMNEHPDWESVSADHSEKPSVHSGFLCYRTAGWQKVDAASQTAHHREHLASILSDKPDIVTVGHIKDDPLYYEGPYRLTVDTQPDFILATKLIEQLAQPGEILSLEKILLYLRDHPELVEHNAHVRQRLAGETSPKVLIAVQAGGKYGNGHLARGKALARNLQEFFSASVSFWLDTTYTILRQEMLEEGYNVIESSWSLPETVRQGGYNKVVIDFQDPVPPSLVEGLRMAAPNTTVIPIDNNGMGCMVADAVIFPNAHACPDPRWASRQEHIFQGALYVILGVNFLYNPQNEHLSKKLDCPAILITMGGVDPNRLSEKILDAVKDIRDCHFDLVIPPQYPHPEELEKIATRMPSTITLHWRLDNIRPLMQRATVAVATFGVTAYELAHMGVPTILIGHNASQVPDIERFCTHGSATSMGDGEAVSPEALCAQITALIQDTDKRNAMHENGKQLVDMQGAYRVAELVMMTERAPTMPVPEA